MPDYQNGKVYKMVAGGMTYVGSTTTTLAQRKATHKVKWKRWKVGTGHQVTSFDLFETGEPVDIVLLEDVPCERREQLHARERHWIETLDCVNRRVPGRTAKEYREVNQDKIKEWGKRYREANRGKAKQYREANQDKIKEGGKRYREANRAKVREYQKKYHDANKDKLKEQKKQRAPCPVCSKELRKDSIPRHIRTVHKKEQTC